MPPGQIVGNAIFGGLQISALQISDVFVWKQLQLDFDPQEAFNA